jgi:hypothetical protein
MRHTSSRLGHSYSVTPLLHPVVLNAPSSTRPYPVTITVLYFNGLNDLVHFGYFWD